MRSVCSCSNPKWQERKFIKCLIPLSCPRTGSQYCHVSNSILSMNNIKTWQNIQHKKNNQEVLQISKHSNLPTMGLIGESVNLIQVNLSLSRCKLGTISFHGPKEFQGYIPLSQLNASLARQGCGWFVDIELGKGCNMMSYTYMFQCIYAYTHTYM